MGDMPLSEMRDALRFDMENLGHITPEQQTRWLNWAYRHVSQPRLFRHTELQSQASISLILDLPSYTVTTPYFWDHLVYVDGTTATDYSIRRKRLVGPKDVRDFEDRNWPRSEPTEYARWGTNVYLNARPGPTQVNNLVVVRGFIRPTALVADTDFTTLRPEFDEVILVGARWRGFRSLGRYDIAEIAKADFVDLVRDQQEQRVTEAEDWGGMFELETQQYQEE